MRRAVLVTILSGLLTLGHLASVPSSAVRVDQRFVMPASGTVTFAGHGYGHGHGMSQHGAQGAALQGKTWQQIVGFYYPGTTLGTRRGSVRVHITGDTTDVRVDPRAGLEVRDLGSGKRWTLPANGARKWRLHVRDGRSVVQYYSGRWYHWRWLVGDGGFYAAGQPLTLWFGGKGHVYRGMLVAARPSPGSTARDTVNVLSMDNYLRSVVPREMPATWAPHAVRSQAVAARTYAAYGREHPRAAHFHFCDTTACQVYGGVAAEHPASDAAVRDTSGSVLLYNGAPAFTQFSSSSGGWTAANRFAYLPAQADPYDGWSGNAHHNWRVTMDIRKVEQAWPAIGKLKEIRFVERDGNGEWRGRVLQMVLVGSKATRTVSGNDARWKLGLKSTWFTVAATKAA